jgi:tetratricopeptide (TPR) repeat protein
MDVETLQRKAERHLDDPWAWWKLGAELLRTAGRSVFEQTAAAAALLHARSLTDAPELLGHLAAAFADLGDADLAFETLRPVAGDPEVDVEDQERVAHFLIEAGHGKRAVELLPVEGAALEAHLPLRLLRAVGLGAAGESEAALREVEEVLRRDGGLYDALVLRARILGERGDTAGCVAAWQEVVATSPADPSTRSTALTGYGLALSAARRHDEAVEILGRAAREEPSAATPYLNLAFALLAAGQLGPAERAVKRALTLEPTRAEAHHDLGLILEAGGQWEQAVPAFQRSLELAPEKVVPHLGLARVLEQLGRSQDALDTLVKAATLQPKDPQLRKQVVDAIAGMRSKVARSDTFGGSLAAFTMWQVLELVQNNRATGRVELTFADIRANLFVRSGALVRVAMPDKPTLAESLEALPLDRAAVAAALARVDRSDDVAVGHQLIARKLLTRTSLREAVNAQLLSTLEPLMERREGTFAVHREPVAPSAEDGELDLRFALLEIARMQDTRDTRVL